MTMKTLLKKVIGDESRKELRKIRPIVEQINSLESDTSSLSDEELREATPRFKDRLAAGESLDRILPEAFAVVRETAKRRLNMRHYDVQLVGGVVLHRGKIAEMRTGEGKTLVATLSLYLNALEGKGAHLVTQNDYLAKRDAQWMGQIYSWLGLSVGILQHDGAYRFNPAANLDNPSLRYLDPVSRREAYSSDVTYGTNNEFGFDYLRDNMVTNLSEVVQPPHNAQHFAIVDEVDNLLIDEARTPLIISGPAEETEEIYRTLTRVVPRLQPEIDYVMDIKLRSVSLTDSGALKVEKLLNIKNLYDPQNFRLTRFLDAALKAHVLYQRDRDYVVKDGEVIIVDEFTGRLMKGRRWSDGLHQAVEAKEGVKVLRESITYATITLQNYFRLYKKLAGMTGTAYTEREEFDTVYKLDVIVIPTHLPMVRDDQPDLIYRSKRAKFEAAVEEVEEKHSEGRPVLVGTASIDSSELMTELLRTRSRCDYPDCRGHHKVCPLQAPHVLNAKQHEREALIVAEAGRPGSITIATNMAGRGTDIILGGNPERLCEEMAQSRGSDLAEMPGEAAEKLREEAQDVWQVEHQRVNEVGGLHIVGTERHESRRIDNQLRGRAGRQGDPGSSRFFVSFEDDVIRRFAPQWVPGMLAKIGMEENIPLESNMVSKAIEQAQTKVEGHNFDVRKHVVEYDDVMNTQRDLIYGERRKILNGDNIRSNVQGMIDEEFRIMLAPITAEEDSKKTKDTVGFISELKTIMPLPPGFTESHLKEIPVDELHQKMASLADNLYGEKEAAFGSEIMRKVERLLMLQSIDRLWIYHLTALDEMRQGAGLRGYGGQDPLTVYKREAHDMWQQLTDHIRQNVVRQIFHLQPMPQDQAASYGAAQATPTRTIRPGPAAISNKAASGIRPSRSPSSGRTKVGRNDPCTCGSGRKYKKCCGSAMAIS